MTTLERAALLPVSFFARPADTVAADLLGRVVVSTIGGRLTAGRIVETEAYLGATDPASHAWGGRRHPSNESLYAAPGTWYVYRSYGIHWCSNLVTAGPAAGAAVLLRALEPVGGLPLMRRRRGAVAERALCAGPGRLAQALGLTGALDGRPHARASRVWVVVGDPLPASRRVATPRIGLTRAADWPLRFVVAGTRWASRPAPPAQRV